MNIDNLIAQYPRILPYLLSPLFIIIVLLISLAFFLYFKFIEKENLGTSLFAATSSLTVFTLVGFLGIILFIDIMVVPDWKEEVIIEAHKMPSSNIPIVAYQLNNDGTITAFLDTINDINIITTKSFEFGSEENYAATKYLSGFSEYGLEDQYIEAKLFLNKEDANTPILHTKKSHDSASDFFE